MPRNTATILVFDSATLTRYDIKSGTLSARHQRPRPDTDDLGVLVDIALRQGSAPYPNIWLLSTEVWTQVIPMPPALRRAPASEQERALALEVESLSGLPAGDLALAWRLFEGPEGLPLAWVSACSESQLQHAHDATAARGARLRAVLHPAGLQKCALPSIDLWPDVLLAFPAQPEKAPLSLATDPRLDLWPEELRDWLQAEAASGWRVLDSFDLPNIDASLSRLPGQIPSPERRTLRPDSNDEKAWIEACAEALLQSKTPQITTRPKALATSLVLVASLSLALITLLACALHHQKSSAELALIAQKIQSASQGTQVLQQLDRELAPITKSLTDTRARLAALELSQQNASKAQQILRLRLAALLDGLAREIPEDLVLESIEARDELTVLRGLSLEPGRAGQLSTALARRLKDLHWIVEPPSETARKVLPNGGPWSFEIQLRETTPALARPSAGAQNP